MPKPAFATDRWYKRQSRSKNIDRRVWFDPVSDYEYERCNESGKRTKGFWHEIDASEETYRDADALGRPVPEDNGRWKRLK